MNCRSGSCRKPTASPWVIPPAVCSFTRAKCPNLPKPLGGKLHPWPATFPPSPSPWKTKGPRRFPTYCCCTRDAIGGCIDPSGCSVLEAYIAKLRLDSLGAGATLSETVNVEHLTNSGNDEASAPSSWMPITLPEQWLALADQWLADAIAMGLTAAEGRRFGACLGRNRLRRVLLRRNLLPCRSTAWA